MTGAVSVVAVAPHPDDETLGCGGTLALHATRGDRVTIVWMTSGERGVPGADHTTGAAIRRREARAAISELGVADGVFLGLPDGALGACGEDAVERLAKILASRTPTVVYAPHADEAHPDHAATARITLAAMRRHADPVTTLWGYEVWSPTVWPHHSEDVSDVFDRKLAALACHRSQVSQVAYAQMASGLASFRGAMITGSAFAESFVSMEWREDHERIRDDRRRPA